MRVYLFQNNAGRFVVSFGMGADQLPHDLGPWTFYKTFELSPVECVGKNCLSAIETVMQIMQMGHFVSPFRQGECTEDPDLALARAGNVIAFREKGAPSFMFSRTVQGGS